MTSSLACLLLLAGLAVPLRAAAGQGPTHSPPFNASSSNNSSSSSSSTTQPLLWDSQLPVLAALLNRLGSKPWQGMLRVASPFTACVQPGIICCDGQGGLLLPASSSGSTDSDSSSQGSNPAPVDCTGQPAGVAGIQLPGAGLIGGLLDTDGWEALGSTLQLLNLANNSLTGPLPESIGRLTGLRRLFLSRAGLRGQLPSSLGRLSMLAEADLSANYLSGPLPGSITSLGLLSWLDIGHNQLSSGLQALSALPMLRTCLAPSNRFSGPLPSAPSTVSRGPGPPSIFPALQHLDLSLNQLTGSIPQSFSQLPMSFVNLGGNQLNGTVPTGWSQNARMETLVLSGNQLTGSLPQDFGPMNLQVLVLRRNKLSGPLPPALGNCRSAIVLDFSDNAGLTGPLPDVMQATAQNLALLDIAGTRMHSSSGRLPPWLDFTSYRVSTPFDAALNCPAVTFRGSPSHTANVPPSYWSWGNCTCDPRFDLTTHLAADGTTVLLALCAAHHAKQARMFPTFAVVIIVLCAAVLAALVGTVLVLRVSPAFAEYRATLAKRQPPGAHKDVTLVLTDVQGSTELWEWNGQVMAEAIDMHDRIIRSQLAKHYGYEVQTEGDAFLVAFHEPYDAAAWCLATQLALHHCDWPMELFSHPQAAIVAAKEDPPAPFTGSAIRSPTRAGSPSLGMTLEQQQQLQQQHSLQLQNEIPVPQHSDIQQQLQMRLLQAAPRVLSAHGGLASNLLCTSTASMVSPAAPSPTGSSNGVLQTAVAGQQPGATALPSAAGSNSEGSGLSKSSRDERFGRLGQPSTPSRLQLSSPASPTLPPALTRAYHSVSPRVSPARPRSSNSLAVGGRMGDGGPEASANPSICRRNSVGTVPVGDSADQVEPSMEGLAEFRHQHPSAFGDRMSSPSSSTGQLRLPSLPPLSCMSTPQMDIVVQELEMQPTPTAAGTLSDNSDIVCAGSGSSQVSRHVQFGGRTSWRAGSVSTAAGGGGGAATAGSAFASHVDRTSGASARIRVNGGGGGSAPGMGERMLRASAFSDGGALPCAPLLRGSGPSGELVRVHANVREAADHLHSSFGELPELRVSALSPTHNSSPRNHVTCSTSQVSFRSGGGGGGGNTYLQGAYSSMMNGGGGLGAASAGAGPVFRGLRVRMAVATGAPEATHEHTVTQRVEYLGDVFRRVQALAELPSGGQVLLDGASFKAIHGNLSQLGVLVAESAALPAKQSGPTAVSRHLTALSTRISRDVRQSIDLFRRFSIDPEGVHGSMELSGTLGGNRPAWSRNRTFDFKASAAKEAAGDIASPPSYASWRTLDASPTGATVPPSRSMLPHMRQSNNGLPSGAASIGSAAGMSTIASPRESAEHYAGRNSRVARAAAAALTAARHSISPRLSSGEESGRDGGGRTSISDALFSGLRALRQSVGASRTASSVAMDVKASGEEPGSHRSSAASHQLSGPCALAPVIGPTRHIVLGNAGGRAAGNVAATQGAAAPPVVPTMSAASAVTKGRQTLVSSSSMGAVQLAAGGGGSSFSLAIEQADTAGPAGTAAASLLPSMPLAVSEYLQIRAAAAPAAAAGGDLSAAGGGGLSCTISGPDASTAAHMHALGTKSSSPNATAFITLAHALGFAGSDAAAAAAVAVEPVAARAMLPPSPAPPPASPPPPALADIVDLPQANVHELKGDTAASSIYFGSFSKPAQPNPGLAANDRSSMRDFASWAAPLPPSALQNMHLADDDASSGFVTRSGSLFPLSESVAYLGPGAGSYLEQDRMSDAPAFGLSDQARSAALRRPATVSGLISQQQVESLDVGISAARRRDGCLPTVGCNSNGRALTLGDVNQASPKAAGGDAPIAGHAAAPRRPPGRFRSRYSLGVRNSIGEAMPFESTSNHGYNGYSYANRSHSNNLDFSNAYESNHTKDWNALQEKERPAVAVMDMGMFSMRLGGSLQAVSVMQLLVPGLEERARMVPRLDTALQLQPGYLDAPATALAPLGIRAMGGTSSGYTRFPEVTLVFCAMDRYAEMVAVRKALAGDVMNVYNDTIRRSLLAVNGYECQEQQGSYMIAFADPFDAIEWCLLVQELMMEVQWTADMLALPGVDVQHDISGRVLLRGPRVKMGIYQGAPTRVVPHSTTGRADYFGPLVNRAARYCHAACQGGQVVAARELVEELLRSWAPPGTFLDAEVAARLPVHLTAQIEQPAADAVIPHWTIPVEATSCAAPQLHSPLALEAPSTGPMPAASALKAASASKTAPAPSVRDFFKQETPSTHQHRPSLPMIESGHCHSASNTFVGVTGSIAEFSLTELVRSSIQHLTGRRPPSRQSTQPPHSPSSPPSAVISNGSSGPHYDASGRGGSRRGGGHGGSTSPREAVHLSPLRLQPRPALNMHPATGSALTMVQDHGTWPAVRSSATMSLGSGTSAHGTSSRAGGPANASTASVAHYVGSPRSGLAEGGGAPWERMRRTHATSSMATNPFADASSGTLTVTVNPLGMGLPLPPLSPTSSGDQSPRTGREGRSGEMGRKRSSSPPGLRAFLNPLSLFSISSHGGSSSTGASPRRGAVLHQHSLFSGGSATLSTTLTSNLSNLGTVMAVNTGHLSGPTASRRRNSTSKLEQIGPPLDRSGHGGNKFYRGGSHLLRSGSGLAAQAGAAAAAAASNGGASVRQAVLSQLAQAHGHSSSGGGGSSENIAALARHLSGGVNVNGGGGTNNTSGSNSPMHASPLRNRPGSLRSDSQRLLERLSNPRAASNLIASMPPAALTHAPNPTSSAATVGSGGEAAAPGSPVVALMRKSIETLLPKQSLSGNLNGGTTSGSPVHGGRSSRPSSPRTTYTSPFANPFTSPADNSPTSPDLKPFSAANFNSNLMSNRHGVHASINEDASMRAGNAHYHPAGSGGKLSGSGGGGHSGQSGSGGISGEDGGLVGGTGAPLPYLPAAKIQARVGAAKWLWAGELHVEDMGQYRFKGVAGLHHIVSLTSMRTFARNLPAKIKRSKGERVEPGRGLIYSVKLQAAPPSAVPAVVRTSYGSEE